MKIRLSGSVDTFPAQSDSERETWLFPELHLSHTSWGDAESSLRRLHHQIFTDIAEILRAEDVENLFLERPVDSGSVVRPLRDKYRSKGKRKRLLRRKEPITNLPNNDSVWDFVGVVTDSELDYQSRLNKILSLGLAGNIASGALAECVMDGIPGKKVIGFESAKTHASRRKRAVAFSNAFRSLQKGETKIKHPSKGPQTLREIKELAQNGDTDAQTALKVASNHFTSQLSKPLAELVLRSNSEARQSFSNTRGDSIIICGAFHAMDLAKKLSMRSKVHLVSYPEVLGAVHVEKGQTPSVGMLDTRQYEGVTRAFFGFS